MRARKRWRLTSSQVILLSFLGVVLLGGLVLSLPVSSADGQWTSYFDSLFTAISATCVTGLVVKDTATYWSGFGQAVILALIQVGGLGVILTAFIVRVFSGSKVSLIQRSLLKDSISGDNVAGIIRMSLFILKVVVVVELAGAALLYLVFARDFGPVRGLWYALFHSVSAFCNAGFDLMGVRAQFSSLTSYSADALVNLVIMALIVVGGIGFYTWRDFAEHGLALSRFRLQSKVSLATAALLIGVPALILGLRAYAGLPLGERVLASLFQSVTTRTAGFNTTDLTSLSQNCIMMMVFLMLVGGCSGSTAGGMKTTTFAVLVATIAGIARRSDDTVLFQRRIPHETVRSAAGLLVLYLSGALVGAMLICSLEGLPLLTCLFETSSAIGTVGLTLGITPTLHALSKAVLMALMFVGRIGALTFLFAAAPRARVESGHFPTEDVNVG